jgi:outer membrane protein TolC
MKHIINIKFNYTSAKVLLAGFLVCYAFQLKAQSLDELKTISAENNLALKAQYKSFEAELEQITQAKAWQDPNLSFGYFISPIETRVGPQMARFSLTQALPWFGTFKAKGEIAAYKAEAEFERFQDQKLKLFLQVAEAYYELSALRYTAQAEAEQLQILEDLQSIVQANYENNKMKLVDVLRMDLEIEEQKSKIDVLQQQDQILVAQLNQLLNRPVQTPIQMASPELVLNRQNMMPTDSISAEHPRLASIKNLQASNIAERKLAQKQAMPQFGVGLDYAIIQDRNVSAPDAGQDAIMPMLSVSLPIFGKKNKSRKKAVELQGESLQFQLEDEKTSLETEIQVAKYKQNELMRLVELHDKQMLRLNDILTLSESALANAEVKIEEVLRLYEEHLLHLKMKIRTLADLQKTNQTLGYLTSK